MKNDVLIKVLMKETKTEGTPEEDLVGLCQGRYEEF